MQEFITAAEDEPESNDDDFVEFTLRRKWKDKDREDEVRTIKAYKPSEGQLAVLMAKTSSMASGSDRVAGSINFFASVMEDHDAAYIERRLLDRKDPFGIDQVTEILGMLVEQWSGRPTEEPSGSTPTRRNTGRSSTRRTSASTS